MLYNNNSTSFISNSTEMDPHYLIKYNYGSKTS